MLYYTVGQQYIFAYMVLCGIIMGAIYEVFRAIRMLTVAGKAFTALLDGLMCAMFALVMAAMLLRANGGDLRLYTALGCALGMAIFICGPGKLLRAVWCRAACIAFRLRKNIKNISIVKHIIK